MITTPEKLKEKMLEIYPEVGRYGLEMEVAFHPDVDAWVVTLRKDGHHLSTHLEKHHVEDCLAGRQCVYFGNQLAQFLEAYCLRDGECPV